MLGAFSAVVAARADTSRSPPARALYTFRSESLRRSGADADADAEGVAVRRRIAVNRRPVSENVGGGGPAVARLVMMRGMPVARVSTTRAPFVARSGRSR